MRRTDDLAGGAQAQIGPGSRPWAPGRGPGPGGSGEIRFDRGSQALYAGDASVYRQVPIGVVIPRDAVDVLAALEVCREHEVPVLARGCGTGLAGQSVNAAVVFDFSKYMHQIVNLDTGARTARVQPGVICDQLRGAAAEHGLTFTVDPDPSAGPPPRSPESSRGPIVQSPETCPRGSSCQAGNRAVAS